MLHQIVVLIEECWMHEPGGRLPSLRLKKNLGSIFKEMTILTGENPAATGANKHIQNIVNGWTNDSAVSVTTPVTTPTHSGTRNSPVTTWSFVYLHLEPSKLHDSQYTASSGKISSSKSLFQKNGSKKSELIVNKCLYFIFMFFILCRQTHNLWG